MSASADDVLIEEWFRQVLKLIWESVIKAVGSRLRGDR